MRFDFLGKAEQVLNVFFLQPQQFNLLLHQLSPIQIRLTQDRLYVFQREFQFPKKQNVLKPDKIRFLVQPVS